MSGLSFTILGCGSSGGVPRLGGDWGACDPANPFNARRRCSALVQRQGPGGTTSVLIDTSPDMRAQLLDAGIGRLDAVAYTHGHADHVHGIDDLRMIVFNMRARLPVWADAVTADQLVTRFGYAFVQPAGSTYPPICDLNLIEGPFTIDGPGGPVTLTPFRVIHGDIEALGFRIAGLAYLPDVSEIPPEAWASLQDLDCLVVDALRHAPHPTHAHLARTLGWIEALRPARAVLTNMHVDLDHATLSADLPPHIRPAHDGLTLVIEGSPPA